MKEGTNVKLEKLENGPTIGGFKSDFITRYFLPRIKQT